MMSLPKSLRSCIGSTGIDIDSEVFDTMRPKKFLVQTTVTNFYVHVYPNK